MSKKISGKTWIMIQLDGMAETGRLYSPDLLHRVCGAVLVDGKRTAEQWDALFAAANEAESTMKDAADFG